MNIELEHLKGTFVLLIPPPPSQLLWYSFTPSTKLDLKIEYLYGSKELSVPMKKRMSVWIKNNIDIIFRKILTLPNMECILMNYDTFLQEKISFPKTPPPQAGKQQPNTSQQNRPPIPPPQFTPQSKNFGNKDYQNQGITISFTENLDEDNKKS
ncbi:MAG: Tabersonine 6,7-epoxidase isoform 2 [Marteilia pararefringens]